MNIYELDKFKKIDFLIKNSDLKIMEIAQLSKKMTKKPILVNELKKSGL